jgi:hypothetical protein
MNQPTPAHQSMVDALRLLLRAEREAVRAADRDLEAILLAATIQSVCARLMLVSETLERDAKTCDSLAEPVTSGGCDYVKACTTLLTDAADRLDAIRATTVPLPHGLLFARAALSEALRECVVLGSAS